MISRPSEKRTSVSLSARDDTALARLLLRLDALGVDLSPARLIRALAHVYSETEMLDHVRRYLKSDAARREFPTERRPVVSLLTADVRKLKKLRLRLMAGHDGWVGEIDLLRAYWLLPPPLTDLARRLARFDQQFPDKRTAASRRASNR